MERPSGDQNGCAARSVPGIGLASSSSRERTHSIAAVDSPCATNATCRPFGEIVAESCGVSTPGDEMETRSTSGDGDGEGRNHTYDPPAAMRPSAPAAIHFRGERAGYHAGALAGRVEAALGAGARG